MSTDGLASSSIKNFDGVEKFYCLCIHFGCITDYKVQNSNHSQWQNFLCTKSAVLHLENWIYHRQKWLSEKHLLKRTDYSFQKAWQDLIFCFPSFPSALIAFKTKWHECARYLSSALETEKTGFCGFVYKPGDQERKQL